MMMLIRVSCLPWVMSIVSSRVMTVLVFLAAEVKIFVRMVHLFEVPVVEHSLLIVVSVTHILTIVSVVQLLVPLMFVLLVIVSMEGSVVDRFLLQIQVDLGITKAGKSRN